MTINPAITQILKEANFSNSVSQQIEKTICRYAKPSGCCNTLVYIMRRILNMALSLFGCSDWQRTVRAVRNELNEPLRIKFEALIADVRKECSPKLRKSLQKVLNNIKNGYEKASNSLSNEAMELALKVQNGNFKDADAIEIESLRFNNRYESAGDVLKSLVFLECFKANIKEIPNLAEKIIDKGEKL